MIALPSLALLILPLQQEVHRDRATEQENAEVGEDDTVFIEQETWEISFCKTFFFFFLDSGLRTSDKVARVVFARLGEVDVA